MYTLPDAPGSIGQTLDAGFKLLVVCFKHTVGWSFLMAASIYVPFMLFGALMFNSPEPSSAMMAVLIPAFIVAFIVYLVLYLAVVHRVGMIAQGKLEPIGVSMGVAFRRSWRVMLAGILYMLVVALGMLLIVPGILFMLSLGFYMFCILLDDDGVFESLGRSHRLVWGKWWRTMVVATVVMVVYMIIMAAVSIPVLMVNVLLVESPALLGLLSNVGDMLATAVSAPIWVSVFIVVFHDLKLRTEGQDLEARVEALAPSH